MVLAFLLIGFSLYFAACAFAWYYSIPHLERGSTRPQPAPDEDQVELTDFVTWAGQVEPPTYKEEYQPRAGERPYNSYDVNPARLMQDLNAIFEKNMSEGIFGIAGRVRQGIPLTREQQILWAIFAPQGLTPEEMYMSRQEESAQEEYAPSNFIDGHWS